MAGKQKTRRERKEQIMGLFDVVGEGELSSYDVARILQLEPSSWLNELLLELVHDRLLNVREEQHRSNSKKRIFRKSGV